MIKFLLLILALTSLPTLAKLRIATYNIRNFDYDVRSNTPTNKTHLVKIISEMSPDIMAIQEINQKEEFIHMIDTYFAGKYKTVLSDCGGAHGQKLGFVYNSAKFNLVKFKEDLRTVNVNSRNTHEQTMCHQGSRPLAIAEFKNIKTKKTIVAISVHLKSGGRPSNIEKRFKQIDVIQKVAKDFIEYGYNNVVIMGDFNSTEYINKGQYYKKFKSSVDHMKMVDSTNQLACTSYWWGGARDQRQYPSTLDHILVSNALMKNKNHKTYQYGHCKKLKCEITSELDMGMSFDEVSDHCPIVTEISE